MSKAIPEGWSLQPLSALANYYNGRAFKPADWTSEGLPIIRIAQITNPDADLDHYDGNDVSAKNKINDHDLLFSWSATLTALIWNRGPAVLNQHIFKVEEKDGVNRLFLHQLILNSIEPLAALSHGSTMKHIKKGVLDEYHVEVPPLFEQDRIATILSSVDDVIEKTGGQIDKLKDLKIGMMQELLTKGIGHTDFKDSPVGKIPVKWSIKTLEEAFTLRSGSTPSRSIAGYFSSSPDAYPWVKTLDLDDSVIKNTEEKITDHALANSACKVLPAGTALIAMYGGWNQIGRSGVLGISATTNQAICGLIPKGLVSGEFANYWLIAKRYMWKAIAASSRKDPNITKQDVCDFIIAIPPVSEQQAIVNRLDAITGLIDIKKVQLSKCKAVKKALMQDLLTGKVRVNVEHKEPAVA